MTRYNLREASKRGIPAPREGYEQRKVAYKKYNEAVIKGWSKRVDDDGRDYTDRDFILCERKIEITHTLIQDGEIIPLTSHDMDVLCGRENVQIIVDDNNTFMATTSVAPEAVGVGDTPEEAIADLEEAVEMVADIKKKRPKK